MCSGPCLRDASARSRCHILTPPVLQGAGTVAWTRPIRRAVFSGPEGRTPEGLATPPRTDLMATNHLTCRRDTVSHSLVLTQTSRGGGGNSVVLPLPFLLTRVCKSFSYCVQTEQRTTVQGQVYFLHTQTGVSTWHDPRIPRYVHALLQVRDTNTDLLHDAADGLIACSDAAAGIWPA